LIGRRLKISTALHHIKRQAKNGIGKEKTEDKFSPFWKKNFKKKTPKQKKINVAESFAS